MIKLSSEELLENALQEIGSAQDQNALENIRVKYLGRQGKINALLRRIPELNIKNRRPVGKQLNSLKAKIETKVRQKEKELNQQSAAREWVDLTRPTIFSLGSLHPVTLAVREIVDIFKQIGFIRVSYPEVDWDWYAFESLNMPENHPARDMWETLFVDYPQHPKWGKLVLTPHTSNGQVRELERLGKPPVRMINIARCYRRQQDVTHTLMFHQFEGLVVNSGINLTHLKGTIEYFAEKFYGKGTKSRFRPYHFPFTEPSFEVDFSCVHCQGKGCRFCKSGWHEVGGAGMVHPRVLKNGGFDPERCRGFAFGWGIERTLSLRPDIRIDDIRILYENDIRFLKQF